MNYSSSNIFSNTQPVVRNLIIINVLALLADYVLKINFYCGLYYPTSSLFHPYQFITHMFMHGGVAHLLFNMYALWMFGNVLEKTWGSKRFFIFYMVCGLGAAAFYTLVNYFQFRGFDVAQMESQIGAAQINDMKEYLKDGLVYTNGGAIIEDWYKVAGTSCVGASGAIFGVLLGFGMMYPDVRLQLLFPPVSLKAIWFVLIYGAIELFLAFSQPGGGVAHTAHLGGMIFAFILIKLWQKRRNNNWNNGF